MKSINSYRSKWISMLCTGFIFFASKINAGQKSCEETFTHIYDNKLWGANEDGTPSSGFGSWPEFALPYMQFLEDFIKNNQVHSVVDIGCGDWAFSKHLNWGDIKYTGIDVVKQVIERNTEQFSSSNISFINGDILKMDYPLADLLVCKDVLQHLTNNEIAIFLTKIRKFKHCLITNDSVMGNETVGRINRDLSEHGPNRPLDLTKFPFNAKGVKIFTYPLPNHEKQILYIKN